jgi:histidinol phosphatase-like enzyme
MHRALLQAARRQGGMLSALGSALEADGSRVLMVGTRMDDILKGYNNHEECHSRFGRNASSLAAPVPEDVESVEQPRWLRDFGAVRTDWTCVVIYFCCFLNEF